MNILVTDDNPLTADILCDMLRQSGHVVELATNGEAAISRMAFKDYDVVVMDYYMPGPDGINVVRDMRKTAKTLSVPVIMITAAAPGEMMDALQKQLTDLGRSCLLQKPFDFDVLLLAIEAVTVKE